MKRDVVELSDVGKNVPSIFKTLHQNDAVHVIRILNDISSNTLWIRVVAPKDHLYYFVIFPSN
jgi:hypothetical protein